MNSTRTTIEPESAASIVSELLDAEWGGWDRSDVHALLAARPGWRLERDGELGITITLGDTGGTLHLEPVVYGGTRYKCGRVRLLDHGRAPAEQRGADVTALVDAARRVGVPTAYPGSAYADHLRWSDEDRTLLLQGNDRRAWLAVHPRATDGATVEPAVLRRAARSAQLLGSATSGPWQRAHLEDVVAAQPGWTLRLSADETSAELHTGAEGDPAARFTGARRKDGAVLYTRAHVLDHPSGASLPQRRAALAELYDAVVGGIGDPTLLGGSPHGLDVRWRTDDRTLLLRSDRNGAWLETHATKDLEKEEYRTFEWGGAWSESEPSDFDHLPYVWQLDREGPGDAMNLMPGARIAAGMAQLQEGVETVLRAWVEQLPAQVGEDWAKFDIRSRGGAFRTLTVSYGPVNGLRVKFDDRDGADTEKAAAVMRARGWQTRMNSWWEAEFPGLDKEAAARAAALVVAQLCAMRATSPADELMTGDVSCADAGRLRLTGLGIGD